MEGSEEAAHRRRWRRSSGRWWVVSGWLERRMAAVAVEGVEKEGKRRRGNMKCVPACTTRVRINLRPRLRLRPHLRFRRHP
jgi:hypothetical protein